MLRRRQETVDLLRSTVKLYLWGISGDPDGCMDISVHKQHTTEIWAVPLVGNLVLRYRDGWSGQHLTLVVQADVELVALEHNSQKYMPLTELETDHS